MIINHKKNIGLVFEAAVAYLSRESWQQCPWQRLKKRTRAKCPNQAPARRFAFVLNGIFFLTLLLLLYFK